MAKKNVTLQDIEKVVTSTAVMSEAPKSKVDAESYKVSGPIDAYIRQGGNVFAKIEIGDKSYGLQEILTQAHATNTLVTLQNKEVEEVKSAIVKDSKGKINAEATSFQIMKLLEKGADPNKAYQKNGWTMMHGLAQCMSAEDFTIAVEKYKGNPNITDKQGSTPAHCLLSRGVSSVKDVSYLKPREEGEISSTPEFDEDVTRFSKALNAMRHCDVDFSAKNKAGQTPSEVFDSAVKDRAKTWVPSLPEDKKAEVCKKHGVEIAQDGSPKITDKALDSIIGVGTQQYVGSGIRIAKEAIHDVVVENKDAQVLYEGSINRKDGRPMLEEKPSAAKENVMIKILGDLLGSVEMREANPSKLQAMTQRTEQMAAKGTTQIT